MNLVFFQLKPANKNIATIGENETGVYAKHLEYRHNVSSASRATSQLGTAP
jgi:hypothetical protein